MGLDTVEFVMAIEDAFRLEIANADAARLRTPRDVVAYLAGRLPVADAADARPRACATQRAFYRLRGACGRLGHAPAALRPATPLAGPQGLAREGDRGARRAWWAALRAEAGVSAWPHRAPSGAWGDRLTGGPHTLGELAAYLAVRSPAALKPDGEGWAPAELERAVVQLVEAELGVDMRKFTLDSGFVEHMGVD